MQRMSTECHESRKLGNRHPILRPKCLEWETPSLNSFHYKHNFKEQGRIYGESGECQMDTISSDDSCLLMYAVISLCMCIHMYVYMYACILCI